MADAEKFEPRPEMLAGLTFEKDGRDVWSPSAGAVCECYTMTNFSSSEVAALIVAALRHYRDSAPVVAGRLDSAELSCDAPAPRTERMDLHDELDRRFPLIDDFRRFVRDSATQVSEPKPDEEAAIQNVLARALNDEPDAVIARFRACKHLTTLRAERQRKGGDCA